MKIFQLIIMDRFSFFRFFYIFRFFLKKNFYEGNELDNSILNKTMNFN